MENILVSIIVAAYNVEKYIGNCIESILKQTYRNFELIIIDDGSRDNTKILCEKYRNMDDRITVIHQTNQGVSAARNNGLKKISGDYVTFIDSDDEISDKYLENLLIPCVKEHADISVCLYQYVDEGKKYNPVITNKYRVMDIDYKILQAKIIGRCCGTLIKSDLLKNQFFDTDVYVGEDLLFFCKAVNKANKMAITNDQLYCYYIYKESSYNGTYNDKKYTEIISWNRVIDLFEERSGHFKNTIYRMYGWIVLSNILKMQEFHYSNAERKEYCLKELRRMIRPVFNRYSGGDQVSVAMYPIYLLTCIFPYAGYKLFNTLMKLKHKIVPVE